MGKGWTQERRKKQAEAIRKNKPWLKSTGPKTEKGKARSKMNAFKHGYYMPETRILNTGMWYHRQFLANVMTYYICLERVDALRKQKEARNELIEKSGKTEG